MTYRRSGKRAGLRARWNRAFALLACTLVVGAFVAGTGTYVVVGKYRETASQLQSEASMLAQLRADIVTHAVSDATVMTPERRAQQARLDTAIRAEFRLGAKSSYSPAGRALILRGLAAWIRFVDSIPVIHAGTPPAVIASAGLTISTEAPKVLKALDQAGSASRTAARVQLAANASVEWETVAAWGGLFLVAAGLMTRLARRLSQEVLRPLVELRGSANRLAAGDFAHRVAITRDDEVGDLASSFNAMADAVAGSQRTLIQQANHDSLTGLANRAAFHEVMEAALARGPEAGSTQSILFVDLDDFKDVNDQLGHAAGDDLLRVVASRLKDVVRPTDLVARLGGDEFAILLDGVADVSEAVRVSNRAVSRLAEPISIQGHHVHVGASIGVAMRRPDSDVDSLMREADVAMYSAKGRGKNRVECYDPSLHEAFAEGQLLKVDVGGATARGELVLDYQPILELVSGDLLGIEALVRWQHPTRGLLPPSAFIELAEDSGAIIDIGSWVLSSAAEQTVNWQRRYRRPELWLSVNVSVRQLEAADFASLVIDVLHRTGLEPQCLVVEITESVLASPSGGAAAQLARLRRLGVRVALDDFGSGFSSIGYLRQLPVDILKIDRSFVSDSDESGSGAPLLEAIIGLGQRLDLVVIPEGIEQPEQLELLVALGCTQGQGFMLSRPIRPTEVEQWLTAAPVRALAQAVGDR